MFYKKKWIDGQFNGQSQKIYDWPGKLMGSLHIPTDTQKKCIILWNLQNIFINFLNYNAFFKYYADYTKKNQQKNH